MKQHIKDFGKAKCIFVQIKRNGIVYTGREDYRRGRPAYRRIIINLEAAIAQNRVVDAQ